MKEPIGTAVTVSINGVESEKEVCAVEVFNIAADEVPMARLEFRDTTEVVVTMDAFDAAFEEEFGP